jgi:hypothetical protein
MIHKELQSLFVDPLTYKDVRNMHKARSYQLLLLQTDIEETDDAIMLYKCKQVRKNNFCFLMLRKNTVMFSCKPNLQFLSSIDELYVDGTFIPAPKFFHQPLTTHGLINGHYVTLVFFLLANNVL